MIDNGWNERRIFLRNYRWSQRWQWVRSHAALPLIFGAGMLAAYILWRLP